MKIYIAGKITEQENYKELFKKAELELIEKGYTVINPTILPLGFEWNEYLKVNFAMIDICEGVYMLKNWLDSKGAKIENLYALGTGKRILYQGEVLDNC